ncbi:hypothetical protein RR48_05004, partial [Papilio machaon]
VVHSTVTEKVMASAMLGVSLRDRLKNDVTRSRMNIDIVRRIVNVKWQWAGSQSGRQKGCKVQD